MFVSVSDWVNTYACWIPVWTVFDQSIGGTRPLTETKKIPARRLILEPRTVSLLLSCCSTSTPACLSRTCTHTHTHRHSRKVFGLNWIIGKLQCLGRGLHSECCEFVIKHRRLVWNMVFVSQNNSNMTGIIQTSHKDTGFQINYFGVLRLGWND